MPWKSPRLEHDVEKCQRFSEDIMFSLFDSGGDSDFRSIRSEIIQRQSGGKLSYLERGWQGYCHGRDHKNGKATLKRAANREIFFWLDADARQQKGDPRAAFKLYDPYGPKLILLPARLLRLQQLLQLPLLLRLRLLPSRLRAPERLQPFRLRCVPSRRPEPGALRR